jgi:hypothetical protein
MKKPTSRQAMLGLALITTVLAAFMPKANPSNTVDAIAEPARAMSSASTGVATLRTTMPEKRLVDRISRSDVALSESDPFRSKSWYVPPPPPPPPPPEKPHAPPMPFRYMGMYEDQGKVTVYLTRGDESFAVSQGEKFADSYRLDKVERGILIISYLPLSVVQTLPIGSEQ